MNEENKKIGLSTLNWVLCIIGIIFFLILIVLPPMFRAFIPIEEELTPAPNIPEVETIVVNCTKYELDKEEKIVIHKKNDTLEMLAQEKIQVVYNQEELSMCDNNSTKYQNINGLYYTCTSVGNEITTNSRITFSEFDINNISPIEYNYKQGSSILENELTSSGFTCK